MLSSRPLLPSLLMGRSLCTSATTSSRFRNRNTHKFFWHVKKTNKQADDPLTFANRQFLRQAANLSFVNTRHDENLDEELELLLANNGTYESSSGDTSVSSPLLSEHQSWPRGEFDARRTTRCGLIGRKIGIVNMWLKNGKQVSTTMVQIEDNHVVRYVSPGQAARTIVGENRQRPPLWRDTKSVEYPLLVVGALSGDPSTFTKDYCGLFTESGIMPKKKLSRFPVSPNAIIQPGTPLVAAHFMAGQYVDVIGRSSCRGFQGVMKRWGFAGMPSDVRGCTKSHRRGGSIGAGLDFGRVWAGKKMPGHVGGNKVRQRAFRILRINHKENIIYLRGHCVPGEPGEIVHLFDSKVVLRRLKASPTFFPTCYPEQYCDLPEEEYADDVHQFHEPTISFAK